MTNAGKFRSLLVGAHRGEHFIYIGRVGNGYGAAKVRELLPRLQTWKARGRHSQASAHHARAPMCTGRVPNSWRKSNLPAGPGQAWCARRPSKRSARTSRPRKSSPIARAPDDLDTESRPRSRQSLSFSRAAQERGALGDGRPAFPSR